MKLQGWSPAPQWRDESDPSSKRRPDRGAQRPSLAAFADGHQVIGTPAEGGEWEKCSSTLTAARLWPSACATTPTCFAGPAPLDAADRIRQVGDVILVDSNSLTMASIRAPQPGDQLPGDHESDGSSTGSGFAFDIETGNSPP